MKLEELRVSQQSLEIGESVWEIVSSWSYFKKDTVGKQWVRAVDSIVANISEGYGRSSIGPSSSDQVHEESSPYTVDDPMTIDQ